MSLSRIAFTIEIPVWEKRSLFLTRDLHVWMLQITTRITIPALDSE